MPTIKLTKCIRQSQARAAAQKHHTSMHMYYTCIHACMHTIKLSKCIRQSQARAAAQKHHVCVYVYIHAYVIHAHVYLPQVYMHACTQSSLQNAKNLLNAFDKAKPEPPLRNIIPPCSPAWPPIMIFSRESRSERAVQKVYVCIYVCMYVCMYHSEGPISRWYVYACI